MVTCAARRQTTRKATYPRPDHVVGGSLEDQSLPREVEAMTLLASLLLSNSAASATLPLFITPVAASASGCGPTASGVNEFVAAAKGIVPITDKVWAHEYELLYGIFALPSARAAMARGMHRPFRMLEIGLGCTSQYGPGGSAKLWQQLFGGPTSEIWMAEIDERCVRKHRDALRALRILTGSQSNNATLSKWADEIDGGVGRKLDLLIDDGSHQNADIIRSFNMLWSLVAPGGFYVMEDLQVGRKDAQKRGGPVVSDIIQSWIEQLLIVTTSVALGEPTPLTARTRPPEIEARARRFPLPADVAFITCIREACLLAKRNEEPDLAAFKRSKMEAWNAEHSRRQAEAALRG